MDKKSAIFEAALRLFVEHGFHGTATSLIAKEAGVANGTLFNYFPTKDELVLGLYAAIKQELTEYVRIHTGNAEDIRDFMRSQFLTSLFWALDNPLKFHFIQQFHTSPYSSMPNASVDAEQTAYHTKIIRAGIKQKMLRNLPVDFIISLVNSHTFGVFQYLQSKKLSKAEQHKLIETSYELLKKMLE